MTRPALSVVALGLALSVPFFAAQAQSPATAARCQQLMDAFDQFYPRYDRFTSGTGTLLDRSVAETQCARGDYAEGIRTLETAMRRNMLPIPSP